MPRGDLRLGALLRYARFRTLIACASATGVIVPIGDRVLRKACATAAGWPDDLRVPAKLSTVPFGTGDLAATVTAMLAEQPARDRGGGLVAVV
jgi:predicted signal transduction protein with EAL and GGDEF domain